jgi:hypothetical protein
MHVGLVESLDALVAPLRHGLTRPTGTLGGGAARYQLYVAKAGRVAVAALESHFETRLYEQLDARSHADLASRFLERTAIEWERGPASMICPLSRSETYEGDSVRLERQLVRGSVHIRGRPGSVYRVALRERAPMPASETSCAVGARRALPTPPQPTGRHSTCRPADPLRRTRRLA